MISRKYLANQIIDGLVNLVSAGFDETTVLHEWPADKFTMFSHAVERRRLKDRVDFSVDVLQAVAGLFGGGKGKKNPLATHIEELRDHIEIELDG